MATNNEKLKGVLVDLTRCIGCRGCQVACKSWNDRSAGKTVLDGTFTNPPQLNSDTYTRIAFIEQEKNDLPVWSFIKSQCMHCKDPACLSACPVGAFSQTPEGAVIYNFKKLHRLPVLHDSLPLQHPEIRVAVHIAVDQEMYVLLRPPGRGKDTRLHQGLPDAGHAIRAG